MGTLRFLFVGALCGVAGCGLALDYGPPDPQQRDSAFTDAATQHDAGTDDDASANDAASFGDATDDAASDDASTPPDAPRTGCTVASDCADSEICVSTCDPAGGGHCIPAGEPCALVPTCGCDGVVYDSLCSAHGAHVEAAEDPSLCFGCAMGGTPCMIANQVCLGCPDAPPICVSRPFPGPMCVDDVPVCGCDGHTYTSTCAAEAAGVLHTTAGPCAGPCVTSVDCRATEFCERSACGDVVGTCTTLPTGTSGVCGCSGRRYRGSVQALRQEGLLGPCDRCPTRPTSCCRDSADCAATETCVGGSADCTAIGVCEPLGMLTDGTCWSDEDCGVGGVCTGELVCDCGATCILADMPGTCIVPHG